MLPAYAGMIRTAREKSSRNWSAPRVCGDDPTLEFLHNQNTWVLPAYAGMIRVAKIHRGRRTSAPRVCGDDPDIVQVAPDTIECSPRMRG